MPDSTSALSNPGTTIRPDLPGVKNIVLVHGGLVDGSSWAKVIPLLAVQGFHVTAVQNPLTSLAADVAATTRTLASGHLPMLSHPDAIAAFILEAARQVGQ